LIEYIQGRARVNLPFRKYGFGSVLADHRDRIDAHGAQGGPEAARHRHQLAERHRGGKRRRIAWAHAREQRPAPCAGSARHPWVEPAVSPRPGRVRIQWLGGAWTIVRAGARLLAQARAVARHDTSTDRSVQEA
jgi:hypothetical protein